MRAVEIVAYLAMAVVGIVAFAWLLWTILLEPRRDRRRKTSEIDVIPGLGLAASPPLQSGRHRRRGRGRRQQRNWVNAQDLYRAAFNDIVAAQLADVDAVGNRIADVYEEERK